jgi:1-phosphatidylinositol phosphodiesterase
MTRRLFLLLIIISALFSACGNDSSDSSPATYVAHITCDEGDTALQFVSLTENGTDMPTVSVFQTVGLGYGVMKYLINQGSVPDWESDVPDSCKNSSDLGEDDAGPCVFRPLLNSFYATIQKYGIAKEDIAVTISYNTNGNIEYTPELIDSLGQTLDTYIDGLGYDGQPDLLEHYHAAYTHEKTSGTSNPDWMKKLDPNLTLSRVSMPGTHDTMAHYGGDIAQDIVQTQSLRLKEQLNSGIRALDIRCRHINNIFAIHHDVVFQKANFNDVLKEVESFLSRHEAETIVMRVKEEYKPERNTRSFAETFNNYAKNYPDLFWKYDGNNNPPLRQIRGKVVVLQNFSRNDYKDTPLPWVGIPWKEDENKQIKIQDQYKLKTNWDLYEKWEKVKSHLDRATKGNQDDIYINFLSGSGGSFPYFVASGKSSPGDNAPLLSTGLTTPGWKNKFPDFPRVNCLGKLCTIAYLGTNILTSNRLGNYKRVGIIMADFPGKQLIQKVIDRNSF